MLSAKSQIQSQPRYAALPKSRPQVNAMNRQRSAIFSLLAIALALTIHVSRAAAQEGNIRGIIVDSVTGRPLGGVHVATAGALRGVITDGDGRFILRAPVSTRSMTIEAQLLGYKTSRRIINNVDAPIEIALVERPRLLSEVVVTGTAGGVEQRALGNAVGKVAATDVLALAPAGDVHQLVNGRIPGVTILPIEGVVGTGSKTRIRGVSSPSLPNEPLLYLDGIRVDNNTRAGPQLRNGKQVSRVMDIP